MTNEPLGDLWERVVAYMAEHGWRSVPAKSRDYDQSLFDHCLLEVDAFLQFARVIGGPEHWKLTEREQEMVVVALMAHDYGKTLPEWQDYLHGRRSWLSDVNRGLTEQVVPALYPALGLGTAPPEVNQVLENCINLHMRNERTATNVMSGILRSTGTATDRWWLLAEIVYHVDNLCSIADFFRALGYLRKPDTPFGKHLHVAYHHVVLRGVSTVLVHEAAQAAFESCGWFPLLFYREATLYVRSAAGPAAEPGGEAIGGLLAQAISGTFGPGVAELVVGNPTASMLPKPELFEPTEVMQYLIVAGGRINRQSFMKKPREGRGTTKGRRQVVAEYLGVPPAPLQDEVVDECSQSISEAQPEMVVFKFFKAITSREFLGEKGAEAVASLYDAWLGSGSWAELQGMSTLMPAKDMRHVDRFWTLSGNAAGQPTASVRELAPDRRMTLLVESLAEIAGSVYGTLPSPPSRKALAEQMAAAFASDLVAPTPRGESVAAVAREQREAYGISKSFMGGVGRRPRYLCSLCNAAFATGTKAPADLVDKPESHTNRGVSHGGFDRLVICDACRYERVLRQLLLGDRAKDLIVLFPRRMVGIEAGRHLVAEAREFAGRLRAVMLGDGSDADTRASFGLTSQLARRMAQGGRRLAGLSAAEMAEMFSYRASEDNRRKRRRELEKALKEEHGEEVSEANSEWGTDFPDWEAALDAVVAGAVPGQEELRKKIYGLRPRIQIVCRTPNLIMLPLADSVSMGKESDTDAALRRVFVELGLALALDCAVAIVGGSEPFTFPEPRGVAWVPPVGPARRLLLAMIGRLERRQVAARPDLHRGELERLGTLGWIPLSYAGDVFSAIGAASLLSESTSYSDRTDLYQVLSAPTVGHVVRRIEQKNDGQLPVYHLSALKQLEEVLA